MSTKSLLVVEDEVLVARDIKARLIRMGYDVLDTARKGEEAIQKALDATRWNRKAAARLLQISYKALLYKIKQCGLEGAPSGPRESGPVSSVSS